MEIEKPSESLNKNQNSSKKISYDKKVEKVNPFKKDSK
jgi:hypothetical protein